MVDHRRTPSRRAYSLPGWFFGVAALACVVGLGAVAWSLVGDGRGGPEPRAQGPAAEPTSGSKSAAPVPEPAAPKPVPRARISVEVLNASATPGLAADTAKTAQDAGWNVASVGNWGYGAGYEAVYYPPGEKAAARQLADDLKIEAVEPAKTGMTIDQLTVLVLD